MKYEYKTYGASIKIPIGGALFQKKYGKYTRNGVTRWRNYHRELKNGKGYSSMDILHSILFMETPFLKFFKATGNVYSGDAVCLKGDGTVSKIGGE